MIFTDAAPLTNNELYSFLPTFSPITSCSDTWPSRASSPLFPPPSPESSDSDSRSSRDFCPASTRSSPRCPLRVRVNNTLRIATSIPTTPTSPRAALALSHSPSPTTPSPKTRSSAFRPRRPAPSPPSLPSTVFPTNKTKTHPPASHAPAAPAHLTQIAPHLYLALTAPGAPPPTLLWSPHTRWGAWRAREVTHIIALAAGGLRAAREAAEGGARVLRLVVPRAGDVYAAGEGRAVRLDAAQLDAAIEFVERAMVRSAFDDSDDEGDGERRAERNVVVCCAAGLAVDAVGVVVGFLAAWERRSAYAVSARVDADPRVRGEWKGLLSWQDVEFVGAAAARA